MPRREEKASDWKCFGPSEFLSSGNRGSADSRVEFQQCVDGLAETRPEHVAGRELPRKLYLPGLHNL